MPLYTYLCAECGPFEEMVALAEYSAPAVCPACAASAPRQMAAPQIRSSAGDEPRAAAPRHRLGCGCCSPRGMRPATAEAVAAGAPKSGAKAAAGSFLDRA